MAFIYKNDCLKFELKNCLFTFSFNLFCSSSKQLHPYFTFWILVPFTDKLNALISTLVHLPGRELKLQQFCIWDTIDLLPFFERGVLLAPTYACLFTYYQWRFHTAASETETVSPSNPEIFTIWTFIENVWQP